MFFNCFKATFILRTKNNVINTTVFRSLAIFFRLRLVNERREYCCVSRKGNRKIENVVRDGYGSVKVC